MCAHVKLVGTHYRMMVPDRQRMVLSGDHCSTQRSGSGRQSDDLEFIEPLPVILDESG